MTKTFERFLRAFSDDDLTAFARDRSEKQPPYWRVMEVALRIELDRRGLRLEEDWPNLPAPDARTPARGASAPVAR